LLAVKIRCRNRRTSASARRQSTWRQRKAASSGQRPRRPGPSRRPACPSVPGLRSSSSSQAHLTASAPFRVRARCPGSGQLSETTSRRGQPSCPGLLSPLGRRHSLLGHPIPAEGSALLTVGPPAQGPDPDGVTTFRTHELRPGWVPPIPRGRWCSPGRVASPTGTRRFPAAVPLPRHDIPPCEALLHEASTGVQSRSPVRSSPRPRPGVEPATLRLPPSFAPNVTGGARQGRGQAIEHGPGTTLTTSADPPILRVHSMRATSRRTARSRDGELGRL
jgi:hypothetical protein